LTRRFIFEVPAVALVIPQFLTGAVAVTVAAAATGALGGLRSLSEVEALLIVVAGVVATALPFGALLLLSEVATAAQASLVAYLVPLLGVIGSVWFLREPLTLALVVGGALILAGVVLAERAERRSPLLTSKSERAPTGSR
jgi:drug/metabolite transporter (DMT)-like permease